VHRILRIPSAIDNGASGPLRDVHADPIHSPKLRQLNWLACGKVTGPQPLNVDLVVHGTGSKKAHSFSYKWVKSEQCRTSTSYIYTVPLYVSSLLVMFSSTKVPMSRLPMRAKSILHTEADQYQIHPRVPACSNGEGQCNITFSVRHSAFHVPQNPGGLSERRFWFNGGQTDFLQYLHQIFVGKLTLTIWSGTRTRT